MNKKRFFTLSLALILVMSLMFSSCGVIKKRDNGESSGKTYSKGILTETTYESEYLNLKFTAPESYIMATESDMDNIMNSSMDVVYEDADESVIDYIKTTTVYEMMVSSANGTPSLSLMTEKLAFSNMTVDQYIDSLNSQMESITTSTFSVIGEGETKDIAGETYTIVSYKTEIQGIEVFQDYLVRKIDNIMVGIVVTYTSDTEVEAENLIDQFQAIA